MSESAKINLVGFDKSILINNIQKIRIWDNNNNYPIIVIGNEGREHYDTIDNVFKVIIEDKIEEYLANPPKSPHQDLFGPEKKMVKEPIKPDRIHKGVINFEIRWYGKQAHIVVDEPDFHKRVVMLHQVYEDLGVLVQSMRDKPKEVKKNFTTSDRASVIKSRYLIDKFINSYLGRIWAQENLTEAEQAKIIEKQAKADEREINEIEKEILKNQQEIENQFKNKI
jgi:hypothetical protein